VKIVVGILAALVVLVGVVALWGSRLPVAHVATRVLLVGQPRDTVWKLLTDFPNQAAWRSDVKSVRRKEGAAKETWIEDGSNGEMPLETTELEAPHRLVRTIVDPSLPFGGSWTYELAEEGTGTRLTITENGEVRQPIFRFVSHYLMNQAGTIESVMKSLAAHFGEPARISGS
jgi:uncharacterized protein YndB with AHSA1/START domain